MPSVATVTRVTVRVLRLGARVRPPPRSAAIVKIKVGGINLMVRIHTPASFVRFGLLLLRQGRNVVHVVTEDFLAVVAILSRVQNVLMPELVNRL